MSGRWWPAFLVFACTGLAPPAAPQGSYEKYLASAEERLRLGDSAGAEKLLLAAAKVNPKSAVVHNNLGALYLEQHRFSDSIREFSAACALDPDSPDAIRNLGTSHFLAGDYAGALQPLKRAKELDATDLRTHYQLGYSLLMLERPGEAEPELEYVRAAMPNDPNTLFALVKMYQAKLDQPNAARTFDALRREHPNSVFVHILLGESYDIQENWPAAIEEFQKAIQLAPSLPRLHFAAGFLYWESAQYPLAAAEFKKELEINPLFGPALYYQGDIALGAGEFAEALRYFQSAAALNPDCLEPLLGEGKTYLRLNQPENAIRQFERAVATDAHQPDVYYWMAAAYRRLGQSDKSKEAFRSFQAVTEEAKKTAAALARRPGRWSSPACISAWRNTRPRYPF